MITGFARRGLVGACASLTLLGLASPASASADLPTLTVDARPGTTVRVGSTYTVTLPASLDVGVLVGQSDSMQRAKNALAASGSGFVTALRAASPDAEISLASFVDFPVSPHGSWERSDYPFLLHRSGITASAEFVAGTGALIRRSGLDAPDAQLFALAHGASGRPAQWTRTPFDPPEEIAAVAPTAERFGGMRFRRGDAAHVSLLVSHGPFHTPSSYAAGSGSKIVGAPTADETIAEMNAAGVRFAGVAFGEAAGVDPGDGFDALAVGTGTPLTPAQPRGYVVARDSDGSQLAEDMIDALRRVAWKVEPTLESCDRSGVDFAATPAVSAALPSGSDASFTVAFVVPADVPSDTTVHCTIGYAVGGIVSARQAVEITVDADPPHTLMYPVPGWDSEQTWLGAPPEIVLSPVDIGVGSSVTYYEIGSPPATPTTASPRYDWFDKPRLQHGESIAYFSVDAVGNAEPVRTSWTARVDTTPPITEADFDTARRTTPAPVTLTADDGSGSGVARTHYEIGATPATPTVESPVYDPARKPTLANGERIAFFSVDEVGHAEASKLSPGVADVRDADPVEPTPATQDPTPAVLPDPIGPPAFSFAAPPAASPVTVSADLSTAQDGRGRHPFVLVGRSASVGCRASSGALNGCAARVTSLRRLTTPSGTVLPTGTVLATGTSTPGAAAAPVLATRLTLTAAGRRAFARRPLGVTARLELRSRTATGAELVGRTRVRLMRDDELVLRVPARAVALPRASRILLDRLARTLTAAKTVRCAADTDDRGTARGDRALTRRQAAAACRLLRARGLRARFEVVGHGHQRPRASNDTPAGRALNRRLTITTTF